MIYKWYTWTWLPHLPHLSQTDFCVGCMEGDEENLNLIFFQMLFSHMRAVFVGRIMRTFRICDRGRKCEKYAAKEVAIIFCIWIYFMRPSKFRIMLVFCICVETLFTGVIVHMCSVALIVWINISIYHLVDYCLSIRLVSRNLVVTFYFSP